MTLRKLLPLACAAILAACGGELTQDEAAASTPSAPAASAVSTNGRLRVCGNRICNASNAQVQLKGMSWFWSNTGWGAERFYNATAVSSVAGWGATVVRAAIGVHGTGSIMSGDRAANVARARALIDGAIAAGVYVIVDWHSHEVHQAEAQSFFQELATRYASSPNIIWETYNEPTSQSWTSLKAYHEAVIRTIRAAGSQNLVIVGSPTWSQDVDVATANPVADANTAYTLHFYAGTHGQYLRDKANTAMSRGYAVFVTEWGTCDASGNGGFNPTESQNWANWMDQNKISSANWSLNDKAETASALVGGASATGPWADSALTQSGAWVKAYIARGSSGGGTTNYTLTVSRSGTGSGTVTSNVGGINCGSTCSASYASGTTVTLTATPATGSTFASWSGACTGTSRTCTVSMTAARTATASFTGSSGGTTYALNVTRSGAGSGTVTSNTGGINCGSTCSASYASGTTVTLTATAASGSTFGGWSGACTGTSATCVVSMTTGRTATATFNGSSGGGTAPCASAITFTTNTGNFNSSGAVCYRTAQRVNGWGCSNFTGRTVSVNGGTATATCGGGPLPLAQVGGYTYFSVSAGTYPWASIYIW